MKLSKREFALLMVLVLLIVVAASSYFLIMPLMDRIEIARQEYSELDLQATKIKIAVDDTRAGEVLDEQLDRAKEGYDIFYGTINSYNIDSILRGLLTDNGLNVTMMNISDYQKVDASMQDGDNESTDQQDAKAPVVNLMRSTVELAINGPYDGMLNFLDELNSKSFGISAETVNISLSEGIKRAEPVAQQEQKEAKSKNSKKKKSESEPTPESPASQQAEAVFRIYIYGIEQPQGVTFE